MGRGQWLPLKALAGALSGRCFEVARALADMGLAVGAHRCGAGSAGAAADQNVVYGGVSTQVNVHAGV